jgi:putative redox protein
MGGIKAVATLGAPFDPSHVVHNFEAALPEITRQGQATVTLGGAPVTIGKGFLDDIRRTELGQSLAHLNAALLVLHAPRDAIVSIDNAAEIFMAARHPKSFVTLDGADHLITDPADADYAAEVIATWARRYLDLPKTPAPEAVPEGVLRVSEADPGGFAQDITDGAGHHLTADEPRSFGGTDRGLSPYGLVAAGLGACTSMTIRMYARRKGWPLEHVSVDVSHAKQHAADAEEAGGARIDRFDRVVTLTGPLDADQRARLMEIADKCPVHRTLERGAEVVTTVAPV